MAGDLPQAGTRDADGPVLAADGRWFEGARIVPSPHREPRPEGVAVDLLVIHGISLPATTFGGPWVEALFTGTLDTSAHPDFIPLAGLRVSSHLFIRRDGELVQFVGLDERAWHAGASSFDGRDNCNDYAIGIELEGCDTVPYTRSQYRVLARVTRGIRAAWPAITPGRIVGHADIAPGRKTDPGPAFDWPRFQRLLERWGEDE